MIIAKVEIKNNTKLSSQGLTEKIVRLIKILTFKLLSKVKSDKLSGGVLNVRTGNLRRSINAKFSSDGKQGTVGTNVVYGAVHELGLSAVIREHIRIQKMVFGRPVDPFEVKVSQHTKIFPERSFLRSALAEMEPEIQSEFNKLIEGHFK